MNVVTNLAGQSRNTTLDVLLESELQDLFSFWVENPVHRDFFRGYALAKGIDADILDDPRIEGSPVIVCFPDLD